MYLHIIWNDLLQDNESIAILNQQMAFLRILHELEIEEVLVTICSDFKGESYPHSFEIVTTHESVDKLRKVIEKDGTSIIYSGSVMDYKELLIAMYFAIAHMARTEEAITFVSDLANKMKSVDQIVSKKLQHLIERIENGG